jgi:hypothetical protein
MITLVAPASAAQVVLQLESADLREGQSIELQLAVTDAQARGVPTIAVPSGLSLAFVSQSQQRMMINFQTTLTTAYHYSLSALKAGDYTIGPVSVATDAGTLVAAPLRLHVGDRLQVGPEGLVGSVSDTTPWVGQTLLYHLRFTTQRTVVSGRWTPIQADGFADDPHVEPLSADYRVEQDGRPLVVEELYWPLRVTRAGTLTLPGGVLNAQFSVKRRRRPGEPPAIFDDFPGFADVQNEVFSSDPIPLTVQALPGAPAGFGGVVGQFSVSSRLSASEVKVGDTVTQEVTVTGDGDLSAATLPALVAEGLRVYDDKPVIEAKIQDGAYLATAVFKRAIVPERPGELTVPPLAFAWFDPETGAYSRAEANGGTLLVAGEAGDVAVASFRGTTPKRAVEAAGEDILPVRTAVTLSAPMSPKWSLLLLLPGAGMLAGQAVSGLRIRPRRVARLGFADLPGDPEARMAGLENIFRDEAGVRLGLAPASLTRDHIAALGDEALALYGQLESHRYGGRGAIDEARLRAWVGRR